AHVVTAAGKAIVEGKTIVKGKAIVRGKARLPALQQPAQGLANPMLTGSIDIEATFDLPEERSPQTLGISLRCRMPEKWKFSDTFPDLEVIAEDDSESFDLDGFKFSDCFLVLRSHAGQSKLDDDRDVSLAPGLNFVGKWKPDGMLGLLE